MVKCDKGIGVQLWTTVPCAAPTQVRQLVMEKKCPDCKKLFYMEVCCSLTEEQDSAEKLKLPRKFGSVKYMTKRVPPHSFLMSEKEGDLR